MPSQKHLIINADCDNNLIFNHIPAIYELLEEIVTILEYVKLSPPYVIKGSEDNLGLIGFIMIRNSHISIHSYKKDNHVALDIYSSKKFNHEIIVKFLKQKFESRDFKFKILER